MAPKQLFYVFTALLINSSILHAWPAELLHMSNKSTNSHIFLIGDLHFGQPNQTHLRDAQAILDGARKLKAHLISEDMLMAIVPDPNINTEPSNVFTGYQRILFGLLMADPVDFGSLTLSRPDLTQKILNAFDPNGLTAEKIGLSLVQSAQRSLASSNHTTPLEEAITPLLGISLLASAQNIPNTNIEWRHALVGSAAGAAISTKKAFETVDRIIKQIETYSDCPILNQFYKEVIDEYQASCKPFQDILTRASQSDQPILNAFDHVPFSKLHEIRQHCSTSCRSFYANVQDSSKINIPNADLLWPLGFDALTKNLVLVNAFGHVSLLDPIIAHHMFKQYKSGPIIVYAGGSHITALYKLLLKLDYEVADYYGALAKTFKTETGDIASCILRQLDLDYYFSHFEHGARILSSEEIMQQNHYCPILASNSSINATDQHNMSLLMSAAQLNHYSTARYCMLANADTSIRNTQGQTALDLARANKSLAVLKLFEEFSVTR